MRVVKESLKDRLTFELVGHGSILQVYLDGELMSSTNLLVYYKIIQEIVKHLKDEHGWTEDSKGELVQ
jgi:hypothetical protein